MGLFDDHESIESEHDSDHSETDEENGHNKPNIVQLFVLLAYLSSIRSDRITNRIVGAYFRVQLQYWETIGEH